MSKWSTVKLGMILRRSEEIATPRTDAEYSEITVRLWGKGVIERGRVRGTTLTGRRFIARARQFIVSRIDARNGAMGLVPQCLEGALVTNDFLLFNIDTTQMDRAFLGWLCRTADFVELCRHASEGTTNRVRLKEERFYDIEIPLPPLAEQRRIVAWIEELAAQINEATELRKQSTEDTNALNRIGIFNFFKQQSDAFPKRSLGEIAAIRGGGTPSKTNPFYWNGKIPWVTPKDMKIRTITDSIIRISERATQESSAKLLQIGAVLVVVRGMILAHTFPSAVLNVAAAINQDIKALIPNEKLLPEFLCAFFWANNSRIVELVEKSTHDTRKLETEKLLNIQIPVPPLSEQYRIVAELGALQTEIDTLKSLQAGTADKLEALLPTVLDRAFKGEL